MFFHACACKRDVKSTNHFSLRGSLATVNVYIRLPLSASNLKLFGSIGGLRFQLQEKQTRKKKPREEEREAYRSQGLVDTVS